MKLLIGERSVAAAATALALSAASLPGQVAIAAIRDQEGHSLHASNENAEICKALAGTLLGSAPAEPFATRLDRAHAELGIDSASALRSTVLGMRWVACAPAKCLRTGATLGSLMLFARDEPSLPALEESASQLGMLLQAHDAISTVDDARKRFAVIADAVPGVIYQRIVRPSGEIRYTYISENAYDLFGVTAERILTDPEALFRHYSPEYRSSFRQKLLQASRELSLWDVEATILRPDGQTRYTHAIARPQKQLDGSVLWTGVILDATRIKMAELAASAAETRTREAIVESLSQGLLMFDASGKLMLRNSHFDRLYPSLRSIATIGASYEDVIRAELDPKINSEVAGFDAKVEIEDRLQRHGARHLVYERGMSGDRFILVNEYRTESAETVVLYTDISELKRRERKIEHLAHHDALTGLSNRVLFNQKLEEALTKGSSGIAVLCLDLDRFKSVNDTLGHQIGDLLLKDVAKRIEDTLRDGDIAARLGGDEFAVIVQNVDDSDRLTSLAWRLLHALSQPFDLQGHTIVSGTSIGIAVSPQDGPDAETLLKNADLALYRAKADGRGTFRFFEAEMDSRAQARRLMEIALRAATARQELEVHYQPLVDVHTSQIIGAEALLRWNRDGHGYVPPLDFIPLAEETGMIGDIGYWVLERACRDAAAWPNDVRVAVNISPAQFRDTNFAARLSQILQAAQLDANRLELEITESMLLRNTDANLKILHDIKALGIRVSMDDFGTGYSSLGNLRSFPFDKIKIDKSFIGDLNKSADAAAIIRAILALGRSLGMTTTAEGVETRDQLAYLRAEGCIEVQGHYFAKALTAEDIQKAFETGFMAPVPSSRGPRAIA